MQHFFVDSSCVEGEKITIKDEPTVHQIKRVMRMRVGEKIIVLTGSGEEFLCGLEIVGEIEIIATVIEKRPNKAEPKIFVTLYQSLTKNLEKFEMVLQKGTELGVSAFVPLVTEYAERDQIGNKKARMEKIVREAAEQCERGKLPKVNDVIKLKDVIALPASNTLNFLLHSRGNSPSLSSQLDKIKAAGGCNIFIGPEGGFSEKEVTAAEKAGFIVVSLGPRILRSETAGIAVAGMILLR